MCIRDRCKQYSAKEALEMGMVNKVVTLEKLEETVLEDEISSGLTTPDNLRYSVPLLYSNFLCPLTFFQQ